MLARLEITRVFKRVYYVYIYILYLIYFFICRIIFDFKRLCIYMYIHVYLCLFFEQYVHKMMFGHSPCSICILCFYICYILMTFYKSKSGTNKWCNYAAYPHKPRVSLFYILKEIGNIMLIYVMAYTAGIETFAFTKVKQKDAFFDVEKMSTA